MFPEAATRSHKLMMPRFVAHFTPQNVVVFVDMDVTESYNLSILFSLLGRLTEGLS